MNKSDDVRYCAVCGKDMLSPRTVTKFIGVQIDCGFDKDDKAVNLEFFKKQFGVYADMMEDGFSIGICWECWLKSLGVKPSVEKANLHIQ